MLTKKLLLLLIFAAILGSISYNYSISKETLYASANLLKVHFIDVGQGDSILIQCPDGKNMLIDGGPTDAGSSVENYLKNNKINKIDVIIGTHPHADHIGGLITIVKDFDFKSIYMPKVANNTACFRDLLVAIKNKGFKINTPKAGGNINFSSTVTVTILAPNDSNYENLNNYSTVIKLSYGNTTFLFEGDAQDISEQEMLEKGYDLKANVLKVGHHGSYNSTSPEFLKAVSPNYAVISAGEDNKYGHPHKETLKKLHAAGVTVYRTDENGTIIAISNGEKISIKTEK